MKSAKRLSPSVPGSSEERVLARHATGKCCRASLEVQAHQFAVCYNRCFPSEVSVRAEERVAALWPPCLGNVQTAVRFIYILNIQRLSPHKDLTGFLPLGANFVRFSPVFAFKCFRSNSFKPFGPQEIC